MPELTSNFNQYSSIVGISDGGFVFQEEGGTMTRKRYLQLVKIAEEVCTFMERKGITKDEGCSIKKLADEMWGMK